MKCKKMLIKYCKENRYTLREVTEKIGFVGSAGYASLYNDRPFPSKYWNKIIQVTKGSISLTDLVHEYLVFMAKKLPCDCKAIYVPEQKCWMIVAEPKMIKTSRR